MALLHIVGNAFRVCDRDLADSIRENDWRSVLLNLALITAMVIGIALVAMLLIFLALHFWWVLLVGAFAYWGVSALASNGNRTSGGNSGGNNDNGNINFIYVELLRQQAKEIYPEVCKFVFKVLVAVSAYTIISRKHDLREIETPVTNGEHFYLAGYNQDIVIFQFEVETDEEATPEKADDLREDLQRYGLKYIDEHPMLRFPEAGGRAPFEFLSVHPLGRRVGIDVVLTTAASIPLIDASRRARLERRMKQERVRPYVDEEYGE